MGLLTDLTHADTPEGIQALELHTQALESFTDVMIERNLLDMKAREVEQPKPRRKRRWVRLIVSGLVVSGLALGGYSVVAKAAAAYNESAAELRRQANDYAAAKAAEEAKAAAAEATAQAKADRELAQLKWCLHADVGEFLAGVPADPVCNPKVPSAP